MCVGMCRGRGVADVDAVRLELAPPGLGNSERDSDRGHPCTLDDQVRGAGVGLCTVSARQEDHMNDSFRAAAERSAAIEARIATDPGSLRMLTGDRPTGALHIGHYFGSIAEPAEAAVRGRRDHPADRGLPGDHRSRGGRRHPWQRTPAAPRQPRLGPRLGTRPRSSRTARSRRSTSCSCRS